MKADQSQLQGLLQEALSRALEHHSWALAEHQDQMQVGGDPEDLERFKISVVERALRECERLRTLIANTPHPLIDKGERRLVEQLEQCHQENLATSRELSYPSKILLAEEYTKLAEKATVLQTKCREVRLALRKYRKEKSSAT
jgi:hypothetical protein